jgi:hypothetical protein
MSNHATHAAIITADDADDRHRMAQQAESRGERSDAQRLRIQARNGYRAAEWCRRTEARQLRREENRTDSNLAAADVHDAAADKYGRKAEELTAEMIEAGRIFT